MPDRPAPRPRPTAGTPRRTPSGGRGAPAVGPSQPDPPESGAVPTAPRVGPRENALHAPEYRAMLAALQQARRDAGLTLEEVATHLKRPISFVWKSEQGERRVDAVELWRFAGLYGRAVSDFLPAHRFQVEP